VFARTASLLTLAEAVITFALTLLTLVAVENALTSELTNTVWIAKTTAQTPKPPLVALYLQLTLPMLPSSDVKIS